MAKRSRPRKSLFFLLLVLILPATVPGAKMTVAAESYGQIRALKKRAVTVQRQKNSFVARVLDAYDIPFQLSQEGVVVRIWLAGAWVDIDRIDVVPLFRQQDGGPVVVGHEIFFFTATDILHLVSPLKIR